MTWVKICGMTNLEDALTAVEAGADAVGFVFYEKSPRNISVEAARGIIEKLPKKVEKVGVFVDLEAERIREIVVHTGLSAVQLHGKRSVDSVWSSLLSGTSVECVAVSKVILMVHGDDLKDEGMFFAPSGVFAVLLDSRSNGLVGGTGKTFDWEATRAMVEAISLGVPVIVAGGVTAFNVSEALRTFHPFGVDVASGVEAKPGKKDPEKVRAFVRAVREVDRKTG
jgi:phosphoribosylanthranilate isomerase